MEKLNKRSIGIILGLLFPVLSAIIIYKSKFFYLTPKEFFNQLVEMGIHLKIVSLAVVPNLLLFFIFIWLNYLKAARGVLLATFIYAFAVFGIKIFF